MTVNHSIELNKYIENRGWTRREINRKGGISYNICTQGQQGQCEILLVDYYPKSGRAYLHINTLEQHNVKYECLIGDLNKVGPDNQIGYNISHINEWDTLKVILDQLDSQESQDFHSLEDQNIKDAKNQQGRSGHAKSNSRMMNSVRDQDNQWTFNPVKELKWKSQDHRILLLGAEPNNSGGAYNGIRDMGVWFRSACIQNSYNGNRKFFTSNIAQLTGAMGRPHFNKTQSINRRGIDELYRKNIITDMLQYMRYADIKATGGGASASTNQVMQYAKTNLAQVLDFWNPKGCSPPPTHTVIQGDHAHTVFRNLIRSELVKKGWTGLYLGMPHPSPRNLSYEQLRRGIIDMTQNFRPFTNSNGKKWNGTTWVAF